MSDKMITSERCHWKADFCASIRSERDQLRESVQELEEYYTNIMQTSCREDEIHCTCVPALRKKVQELETQLRLHDQGCPDCKPIVRYADIVNEARRLNCPTCKGTGRRTQETS